MPAPVAPESRDFEFEATLEDLENRVEAIRAQTQALGLFQDDVMAEIIPVTSPTTPAAPSEVYALGFATEIGVAWQFAKVVGSRRFGVEVRRDDQVSMATAVSLGEFHDFFLVDNDNNRRWSTSVTRYYQARTVARSGETNYFSAWTPATPVSGTTLAPGSSNTDLQARVDTFAANVQRLHLLPGAVDLSALSQAVSVLSQQVSVLSQKVSVLSSLPVVSVTSTELSAVSAQAASALSNALSGVSVVNAMLSARIDTVSQNVSVVSQAVSVLSQSVSVQAAALSVRIDTQSQAVSVLSQAVSIISQQVSVLSQAVSVLSQATSVAQAALSIRIDTQSQSISVISQQVSALSQAGSVAQAALSVRIDTQSQAISVLSQAHSALSQAVSVADAALSVRVDTQSQAISVLSQQVSVLSQAISVVSNAASNALSVANAASNAASIVSQAVSVVSQALSSQAAALSIRIDTQSQSVSVLSQQVSVMSQLLSVRDAALSVRIDTQSQAISVISQKVSVLSQSISTPIGTTSFTPTVEFGGGSVGITYTAQQGYYAALGSIVHFTIYIVLSNKGSSTGALRITGLPITSNGSSNHYTALGTLLNNFATTVVTQGMAYIQPGLTSIDLQRFAAGAVVAVTDADATNTAAMMISGSYLR